MVNREGLDGTLSMGNSPKGSAFFLERGKMGEKGGEGRVDERRRQHWRPWPRKAGCLAREPGKRIGHNF